MAEVNWESLKQQYGVDDDFVATVQRMFREHGDVLEARVEGEFYLPDEDEEPGRPPNADGSVHVGQLDLFCAISKHLCERHPGLLCHARQMNAIKDAADLIVAEFAKPIIGSEPGTGLAAWLASDDTGLSSREMARTLAPLAGLKTRVPGESSTWHDEIYAPSDPSDFGRCIRLLEAVPELVPHLSSMAGRSPLWASYVAHWPEMEALYREEYPTGSAPKLYDLMQKLQDEVRAK